MSENKEKILSEVTEPQQEATESKDVLSQSKNPSENYDRREFFKRLVGQGENKKTERELEEIRHKLKSAEHEKGDGEVEKKAKQPWDKKKIGRRTALAGLITAGAYLGIFKWNYVKRYQHQQERKEYPTGLAGVIEGIKDEYVFIDQDADPQVWSDEIEKAFANSGLERNSETLGIVLSLITAESGFRNVPLAYDYSSIIDEDGVGLVKGASTGGPMELAYAHIMESEQILYDQAKEQMKNIEIGLKFSYIHLRSIVQAYKNVEDSVVRLKCIFADWNSGTFSSRNAGLQSAVSSLSKEKLKLDGLLGNKSNSLIKGLLQSHGISIDSVDDDLSNNRKPTFNETHTWKSIESLYGKPIEPIPANTPVLGAYGYLKKATTGVGSSEEFAEARYEEYKTIQELMKKFEVK